MAESGSTVDPQWGFIGAGKMASAMIRGMIRSGVAEPSRISTYDPVAASAAEVGALGVQVLGSNREVAASSHVLVLAVKPQVMHTVLADLEPGIGPGHLVISIAAGIPLKTLAAGLGPEPRLVRVMPNTPALVGEGAAGFCLGATATIEDEELVRRCFNSIGRAYRVPETLMDAVTGLSGSGPAFAYLMIESLSDGGVRAGLPRDIATALAAQTVLGAAKMVLETGLHPGVLKDQVTSPGGTTIAGLHALEKGAARAAFIDAVDSASRRSAELAESSERTSWA